MIIIFHHSHTENNNDSNNNVKDTDDQKKSKAIKKPTVLSLGLDTLQNTNKNNNTKRMTSLL